MRSPFSLRVSSTVWALYVVLGVGCQSARYVLKEPDRGVVAIPVQALNWPINYREEADKLMADHFPAGFVVEKEEEITVGERTRFHRQVHSDQHGQEGAIVQAGGVSGVVETDPKRELHIFYRRASHVDEKSSKEDDAAP